MTNTLRLNGGVPGSQWGQIHLNNGSYNLIIRQDTGNFFFLVGSNPDGQWNSLRPFIINLASGNLTSENGQNFFGGTTINTSCLLSSSVPLRLATGNGDTGIAMELPSSTAPLLNLQSNFRGTVNTAYNGACFRIDMRNSPLYQWFYRDAGSGFENLIMSLSFNGSLYVQSNATATRWLTPVSAGGHNTGIERGIEFTLTGSTGYTNTGLFLEPGHSYIIYCSTVGNPFGNNNQWHVYCLVFFYAGNVQGFTVANFSQNNINIIIQANTWSVMYQTPGGSGSYTAYVSAQRVS
jgi:hypothetical protein